MNRKSKSNIVLQYAGANTQQAFDSLFQLLLEDDLSRKHKSSKHYQDKEKNKNEHTRT